MRHGRPYLVYMADNNSFRIASYNIRKCVGLDRRRRPERAMSLINALEPSLNIKTTEISEQHLQGQHTTTFAEMFDLSFDARIIDTPGIRGFGIYDMEKDEIGDYFPEFFKLKSECKFNNCLHLDEPKCAVKTALENNEVAWSRYKSYVQMVTGEDDTYRIDNFNTNQ